MSLQDVFRYAASIEIDPDELAKALKEKPYGRSAKIFVEQFVASLDSNLYHAVAKFIKDNPDESVECPKCKRHTHAISPKGVPAKCQYCNAVLP